MREITIADRKLGEGHAPFIVAEVGMNHDGSVQQAIKMIKVAARAGVDAVKFGIFKADEFCAKSDPLYETFKLCELPNDAWYELKAECERNKVIFFATPQNPSDLDILLKVGVPCIKIGSDDLTNYVLIQSYAQTQKPLILSTGMADTQEVRCALRAAWHGQILVCVCTSEYPCPPEHANVSRLSTLRQIVPAHTPVGFSDHTVGSQAAVMAVALGASYFEKHMTLDNSLRGPDHAFSATPEQLRAWASDIRTATLMLGSGVVEPTEIEREQRVNWRRQSGQQIRGELSMSPYQ